MGGAAHRFEPGPKVLAVATVGGAFVAFSVQPWGRWLASALLLSWVLLAGYTAQLQQEQDGPLSASDKASLSRIPRLVRLLLVGPAIVAGAWSLFLAHRGADPELVRDTRDVAITLLFGGQILIVVLDWALEKWARRQRRTTLPPSNP